MELAGTAPFEDDLDFLVPEKHNCKVNILPICNNWGVKDIVTYFHFLKSSDYSTRVEEVMEIHNDFLCNNHIYSIAMKHDVIDFKGNSRADSTLPNHY